MHDLVFPLLCHEPFISSRCHYPPLRSKSGRFLCLCCGSAVDPTTMGSNLEFTAQRRADITLTRDPPGGPSPCFPERDRGVGPSVHWPWSPYVEWSTPVCSGLLTTAITWPHRISKSTRKYSSPYKVGETGCAAQSQEQISQVQNPKASHPSP